MITSTRTMNCHQEWVVVDRGENELWWECVEDDPRRRGLTHADGLLNERPWDYELGDRAIIRQIHDKDGIWHHIRTKKADYKELMISS